jgi:hypothetical protein
MPQLRPPDLPRGHAYTLEPGRPTPGRVNLLRPHIASCFGAGILTSFPSATHFCLALGADSPCADERCAGNLGLTARGPFTPFIATHVSIRTSDTSSRVHTPPSQAYGTLSYHLCAPLNLLTASLSSPTIERGRFGFGRAVALDFAYREVSLHQARANKLRWSA